MAIRLASSLLHNVVGMHGRGRRSLRSHDGRLLTQSCDRQQDDTGQQKRVIDGTHTGFANDARKRQTSAKQRKQKQGGDGYAKDVVCSPDEGRSCGLRCAKIH